MTFVLTTLASFTGTGGANPSGGLIADANGDLFGTTSSGGTGGTVFELAPNGSSYTLNTLVRFKITDGASPIGGLIADANGDLFGTTEYGGASYGTVFQLAWNGSSYTLNSLVSFNGTDGAYPLGSLIANANGDLFGTTSSGGASNAGTVFELAPNGSSYTLNTLVSFNSTDGANPYGSLIADANGDLFGTSNKGGASGDGTVFELAWNGSSYTLNTLVSFNGTDGANPYGSLIADANGDLFGTTSSGGASGDGTVFELTPNGSSYTLNTLVSFSGTDGAFPTSSLIADANGDLFGITNQGGANGVGTVFELTPNGSSYTLNTLVSFSFSGTDGAYPQGSLIVDANGDLFGTTVGGGASGDGTVFEISLAPPTGLAQKGTASNNDTIEITGTGDAAGDTITLYDGNTVVGSGTAVANGAFDIVTTTTFADGTYSITATDTSADGTEVSGKSAPATVVVHQPPAITAGGAATFGGAAAVVLDAGVAVSDIDSGGTLAGATISISSGFLSGDILTFINQNGISGSYNATGVLTLSGTATLAQYQTALDSITYSFTPAGGDATAGGTDTSRAISWQVNDGSNSNGASNIASSSLSVPITPVVTALAPIVNASASKTFTSAQLFSASDAEEFPILSYQVEDLNTGPTQGFWVLNGAVLPNGQITTLTATQLSQLSFVAGSASTPVSDTLDVAASDSAGFGAFTTFTVTAAAHVSTSAPTVTAANEIEPPYLTLAASGLFSATAFGSNTITSYEVEDTTPNSGHWVFNGVNEPTGQLVDVTAAQLSQLSFATGYGSDNLMVRANDGSQWGNFTTFTVAPPPNAAAPAGTSADLILRNGNNGDYEIYDLGGNGILAAGYLGQVGLEWQVAGVGAFNAPDTSDMILRSSNSGAFEIYDISNNNLTGAAAMGQVGLEWSVAGFGDFSSRSGETDMLMRDSNTGQFEIYDLANNGITFAAPMGQVGLEWSVAGFGDFSTRPNETDMLMRNSNTGAFEIYDISNNQLTSAAPMGQVGLEWSVAGFGDFSGNANETDMLMRNSNTGAFEIYDISHSQLTSAAPMGQVGLEWSVAGFGPINGAGSSDMLMRNSNTGAFEVYDIANNQLTTAGPMGQVGLEWSVAGIAADPPGNANAQLAQAMAGYAPDSAVVTPPAPDLPTTQLAVPSILTAASSQNPLPG
jgi:uncharacterized repeat protein (TIGR03803 family)